jgi:hypothetical protein
VIQRRLFIISAASALALARCPAPAVAAAAPPMPFMADLIDTQIDASSALRRIHDQIADKEILANYDGLYDELVDSVHRLLEPIVYQLQANDIHPQQWQPRIDDVHNRFEAFQAALHMLQRRQASEDAEKAQRKSEAAAPTRGSSKTIKIDVPLLSIGNGISEWRTSLEKYHWETLQHDDAERKAKIDAINAVLAKWVDSKKLLARP